MKAVLTLILVLFLSATSMAQQIKSNDEVDVIKMGVVLATGHSADITFEKITVNTRNTIVRLYRYKNSRVKKELAFVTKKNRPKLA
ncbi:hypothetical protein [Maribacter sp. 2304DJ31-5]|uniref:hypothetical protein n=1 Tax=Maribacter sp. 2304DJ31-5 TaxID=3386273 RepID=UPI0039BD5810